MSTTAQLGLPPPQHSQEYFSPRRIGQGKNRFFVFIQLFQRPFDVASRMAGAA
jgi:hypothetical protein